MKNRAVYALVGVLFFGCGTSAWAENVYEARQMLNTHYKNLNDSIQAGDEYAIEQQRQFIANDQAALESLRDGHNGRAHYANYRKPAPARHWSWKHRHSNRRGWR